MNNNDSKLFYDFIRSNGFNPENYYQTLELVQSVPNSMSQYLREYKQFLLSRKVTYSELEEYDIKGALGYLEADATITVPKTLERMIILDIIDQSYHIHLMVICIQIFLNLIQVLYLWMNLVVMKYHKL